MALRTHLLNMDTLIKLHDSRLYAIERNFHIELKTLQVDFSKEKEMMIGKFRHEKRELQAIIEAIEQEEESRENEVITKSSGALDTTVLNRCFIQFPQAKHAFEQFREEIRNRNLEEINMLRISLDAQIEELEQAFETAHLNYLQQTAIRTHEFKELTEKDQILGLDIEEKRKKIDNLQVGDIVPTILRNRSLTSGARCNALNRRRYSTGAQRCGSSTARPRNATACCSTRSTPSRSTISSSNNASSYIGS